MIKIGDFTSDLKKISSWEDAKNSSVKRKNKSQKMPVYTFMEKFLDYSDNSVLTNIINNAIYGKFPNYFSIEEVCGVHRLFYKYKRKKVFIDLPKKPKKSFEKFVNFLSDFGGYKDPNKIDEDVYVILPLPTRWKEVKSKGEQANMINKYVINQQISKNLSPCEMEQLKNIINIGISLKIFSDSTIKIKNGSICKIENLIFNDENKHYFIPNELIKDFKPKKKSSAEYENVKIDIIDIVDATVGSLLRSSKNDSVEENYDKIDKED